MTKITCHMSMSLDGFVAGPDQSRENPLGVRGLELHQWHLGEPTHEADIAATRLADGSARRVRDGTKHVRPDPRRVG